MISLVSPVDVRMQAIKIVSGSVTRWHLIQSFKSEAHDLISRLSLLSYSIPFNSFFNSLKLMVLRPFVTIGLGVDWLEVDAGDDSEDILANIKSNNK